MLGKIRLKVPSFKIFEFLEVLPRHFFHNLSWPNPPLPLNSLVSKPMHADTDLRCITFWRTDKCMCRFSLTQVQWNSYSRLCRSSILVVIRWNVQEQPDCQHFEYFFKWSDLMTLRRWFVDSNFLHTNSNLHWMQIKKMSSTEIQFQC